MGANLKIFSFPSMLHHTSSSSAGVRQLGDPAVRPRRIRRGLTATHSVLPDRSGLAGGVNSELSIGFFQTPKKNKKFHFGSKLDNGWTSPNGRTRGTCSGSGIITRPCPINDMKIEGFKYRPYHCSVWNKSSGNHDVALEPVFSSCAESETFWWSSLRVQDEKMSRKSLIW